MRSSLACIYPLVRAFNLVLHRSILSFALDKNRHTTVLWYRKIMRRIIFASRNIREEWKKMMRKPRRVFRREIFLLTHINSVYSARIYVFCLSSPGCAHPLKKLETTLRMPNIEWDRGRDLITRYITSGRSAEKDARQPEIAGIAFPLVNLLSWGRSRS